MDKYSSVSIITINGNKYMIHKNMLKNIPFFDDFIKQNNDEIDIQVDKDITPEIVILLIDNLYGNAIDEYDIHYDSLRFFKLFILADYLCINIKYVRNTRTFLKDHYLQETFNYAYDKQVVGAFVRYCDYFALSLPIITFDDHMEFELVTRIIKKYSINKINYLFDLRSYDFIIEIFKKNLFIDRNLKYYIDTFIQNVTEYLEKKYNMEHNAIIIDFIVNNKDIRRKFSLYKYGNKYDKEELKIKLYQDYCDEKVEK